MKMKFKKYGLCIGITKKKELKTQM
jgi:hypothetical protein